MDKKDIYENLLNKIPLKRNIGECIVDFVKNIFDDYLKLTNDSYKNDFRMGLIKEFISKSQVSLEIRYKSRYKGDTDSSLQYFKEAIKPLLGSDDYNYNGILPIFNKNYNDIYFHHNGSYMNLYRMTKYKDSMWHIPFEKRHYAKSSGRFSAQCLPCLYLADSIQTCLNELNLDNQESYEEYYVSCFEFDYSSINVLDLTLPKIKVDETEENYYDKAIFSWPLVALCMIKKPIECTVDTPWEYLYPQYIINILSDENNSKIRAVKYFSVASNNLISFNIAIPSRKFEKEGYCKDLKNIFKEENKYYSQKYKYRVSKQRKIGSIGIDSLEKEISGDNYDKIE